MRAIASIPSPRAPFFACCVYFSVHISKMDWSERYATPLTGVFSRAHKLALEHRVEVALLRALEAEGVAPAGAGDEAAAAAAAGVAGGALLARTLAIEKETHHDIMAMVKALAEAMPTAGEEGRGEKGREGAQPTHRSGATT